MKAKLTRLNIRIDYDLKDKIEREAEEADQTQTDFIIGAVEEKIRRKSLVKKKLAEWKIETKIITGKDLRNWDYKQSYNSEEFRLNCLHGVLPASIYDNPDSGLRKTKLEDLNKPTVVPVQDDKPTVVAIEDDNSRTVPSVEELQQMIDDIKYHLLKNYSRC
jgi:predicted transcriptional regulator